MKSRYLFRAKRIDNGEWVEGMPFEIEGKTMMLIRDDENLLRTHYLDENMWNAEIYGVEVDPSTICRCTGRTDRDEKLIFEHDVIAYLDTYSTESGYAEADCTGEVVWDEETLSFQVTNRLSAESWEVLDGECKVLGNAIEHPELLEV